MPRPRPSAVSSQIYRHFAAVTVVITGLLAMMVDWDSNQSAAQAMAHPAPAHAQEATPAKVSNFQDARSSRRRGGGGGDAGGYDGDGGMMPETGDVGYDREIPAIAAVTASSRRFTASALPPAPPPGMPADMFERMRRERTGRAATPAKPGDTELRALIGASFQRSGSNAAGIE